MHVFHFVRSVLSIGLLLTKSKIKRTPFSCLRINGDGAVHFFYEALYSGEAYACALVIKAVFGAQGTEEVEDTGLVGGRYAGAIVLHRELVLAVVLCGCDEYSAVFFIVVFDGIGAEVKQHLQQRVLGGAQLHCGIIGFKSEAGRQCEQVGELIIYTAKGEGLFVGISAVHHTGMLQYAIHHFYGAHGG